MPTDENASFGERAAKQLEREYQIRMHLRDPNNKPHPDLVGMIPPTYYQSPEHHEGAPPPYSPPTHRERVPTEKLKVGIIGGGVGGLYAAMILQDLGIGYEVLEAQGDHLGGRLLTHRFSPGKNDYYDVGAMRFPDTPVMKNTFELFGKLGFKGNYTGNPKGGKPVPEEEWDTEGDDVIPYLMSGAEDLQRFNNKSLKATDAAGAAEKGEDPFGFGVESGGTVPKKYIARPPQYWMHVKTSYFKDLLKKNFKKGWEVLKEYDNYSTRQFLQTAHPELPLQENYAYPVEVVNWLETWHVGSTMFDSSFTETIIEELDFNYADDGESPVQWKCIQGGANRIAQAMADKLRSGTIWQGKRVTKIATVKAEGKTLAQALDVTVDGERNPRRYSHVISTVPLGCLRMIDMDECKLSYALRESVRTLSYKPSVKVGMRFRSRWWEKRGHKGGVSKTDGLSRMIVYPSYGIGSKKDATMIVSYSWSQDSLRLSTFVRGKDSVSEKRMIDLLLHDLAKVHDMSYDDLRELYIDHHAFSWYDSEYAVGGMGFFGPGQFRTMYQEITQPAADHLLYFAGEGASVNHGWIVGALHASIRSILQLLLWTNRLDDYFTVVKKWGMPAETGSITLTLQLVAGQDAGKSFQHLRKGGQFKLPDALPEKETGTDDTQAGEKGTEAPPAEKQAVKDVPAGADANEITVQ